MHDVCVSPSLSTMLINQQFDGNSCRFSALHQIYLVRTRCYFGFVKTNKP